MKRRLTQIHLLSAILCLVAAAAQTKAQSLVITAGTHVTSNGASIILLNTDLQNNGIITSNNGGFVFTGTNNNLISGAGTTKFYGLQLSKQNGGKLLLQKNVSASGMVTFNGGMIDLGNYQFELIYPGGMLQNESEASRIISTGTGEIFITQTLNAPSAVNPGNLGATITSANQLGVTTIRRGHKIQVNALNDQSIARYFSLLPANNAGLNATLKLSYFDAELNNINENSLSMWQKNTNWSAIGKNASDPTANYVQKNGINALNAFTLGKEFSGGPLPLKLVAFQVTCKDANAKVQWITADEINTKQFIIEKSADGSTWQAIAAVPAQGNSVQHNYASSVSAVGADYFRLKMEDIDGKFTYSPVRKTDCSGADKIVIGPNPTTGKLFITASLNNAGSVTINVADLNGRIILSKPWQVQKGLNAQTIDLSGFSSATYMVILKGHDINEARMIIKK